MAVIAEEFEDFVEKNAAALKALDAAFNELQAEFQTAMESARLQG